MQAFSLSWDQFLLSWAQAFSSWLGKNGDILPACIEIRFGELVSLHSPKCPGTIYSRITPRCDGWRVFCVPVSIWLCWVSWLDMKEFVFFRSGLNNCSDFFNSSWAGWRSLRCFALPRGNGSPPGRGVPVHSAVLVWIGPIFFLLCVWRVFSETLRKFWLFQEWLPPTPGVITAAPPPWPVHVCLDQKAAIGKVLFCTTMCVFPSLNPVNLPVLSFVSKYHCRYTAPGISTETDLLWYLLAL